MQNEHLFDNMPETLAVKVQAYAEQTAKKAYNICKRYHVPQDIYEVFVLDAIDILRGQYMGLRATIEQMQVLTAAVPQQSWERTENVALCFIARYYADIANIVEGVELPLGGSFVNAVANCETAKHTGGDAQALPEVQGDAQRLYFTYAILIAAEWCGATEEELRGMQQYGGATMTEEQKKRAISKGLIFQRQRQQERQRSGAARRNGAAGEEAGGLFDAPKKLPEMLPANKTIMQYQNFAYMQSKGVETADRLPDDKSGNMRPLWQGIAEQRQAAKDILEDVQATDAEKIRAAELVADSYAAAQVLDGMQLLPQLMKPISGNTNYSGYVTTPREFYRIATGIENPNNEQILRFLKALAWIDTQRISVAEITEKTITERDSSGVIIRGEDGKPKRKKVQRERVTNFRPLNVVFRTEYEDKVPLQNATHLYLELHNIIKNGRSGEYYLPQNGKREKIKQPAQRCLKIGQYYQFTTEEERTFRAIILSKPKQAEDALLSAVFNYPKRQAEADKRAADAKAAAEEKQSNPEATEEQKREAREAAEAAETQARRYVAKHMGRDYEKLAGMFEKAQSCGLITYYFRRSAAAGGIYKQDKYGRGFVWEWERPINEEKSSGRHSRKLP